MTHTFQDLEDRFKQPGGFQFHTFTRAGRKIRAGCVFPEKGSPHAVIVILPGLSEFIEKYYETAHDLLEQNYAVWIIDWMGQGKSGRYLSNPHKRHSGSFEDDIADLHQLVTDYIKPAAVHTDVSCIPLAMLGHSMGGNIGLRYLAQHGKDFECAAFTAPMFGINYLPVHMLPVASALGAFAPKTYAFFQQNWMHELRANAGKDRFSTDPVRGAVHNHWCLKDPSLQVGGVTFGWVHDALQSCMALQKELPMVKTPCLIGLAENEIIVDNNAVLQGAKAMPQIKLITLENAQHEILMERDHIRDLFLKNFYDLIKTHIIERSSTTQKF